MTQHSLPTSSSRFSRNDIVYIGSLLALFLGLFVQYGAGIALIVIGAVGVAISVVTSFFVTWLSSRSE